MKFNLYTDGACQPNPGQGGWAFIVYPDANSQKKVSQSGYEEKSTNNRMEITAVLEGLKYIQSISQNDSRITLYSDSKYILGAIETWMDNWVKNNWLRKDNKPVLNDDLWKEIYAICQKIPVKCIHIKGHSGHPENEECDKLAVAEIAAANKK